MNLPYRPWLHAYAILTAVATGLLVAIGGNVTSLGVGLAVPDGWWTFDYFTLWAPLEVWWDDFGTRWEHSHRLKGYVVGTLTIGLAGWLWVTQRGRPWLRWLGLGLLALVIAQGVMGAARVDLISQNLAALHGVVGQIFFALTVFVAAATSRLWMSRPESAGSAIPRRLPWLGLALLGVLLVQLALGAWIRHHGAGLAIPDFPTTFGGWLPPLNQAGVDEAVRQYRETTGEPARPATLLQVWMHMAHRLWAVVVTAVAIGLVVWMHAAIAANAALRWPGRWLMLLLGVQIALGALVIWNGGRTPEIATYHQTCGALLLAVAVWLVARLHWLAYTPAPSPFQGEGRGEGETGQAVSSRSSEPGGERAAAQPSA